MSKSGDDRSQAADPPKWWLDLFHQERERRKRANDNARLHKMTQPYQETVVELGKLLATQVGRASGAWHHSAVSNFINGERYTREMAEAFSRLYNLPRFEFLLRAATLADAWKYEAMAGDRTFTANPDPTPRVSEVDQRAAALMESAEDQIASVESAHEGTNRGRRARRSARRS